MLDANIAFKGKKILVTGAAGFIGFYVAKRLLEQDCAVVGIDNMNDYYDVSLKRARLALLKLAKGGVSRLVALQKAAVA